MKKTTMKLLSIIISASFIGMPLRAYALPDGGAVASGTATLTTSGSTLTVDQSTASAVINYNTFNIASGETVTFNQPSATSVTLNRVSVVDPTRYSNIAGALNANGRVFIVNPNGILFGSGCQINTNGVIASTLPITDAAFTTGVGSGSYAFSGSGSSVINQGTINANGPGGFVALLGSTVENSGTVSATVGQIALAGGKATTVSLDSGGLVSVVVGTAADTNPASASDQVKNSGSLKAGDKVLLNAMAVSGLVTNAVNNAGVIEGKTVTVSADGNVVISGTIDGKASSGDVAVSVTSTAGKIDATGTIKAIASAGYGTIDLSAYTGINAAGTLTASGTVDHTVDIFSPYLNAVSPSTTNVYKSPYAFNSKITMSSTNGDVSLGTITADMIQVKALGTTGDASIIDLGKINAHLAYLNAKNDIGTASSPLTTNVDILAAYSFTKGNVYVKADDKIQLGFYLPVDVTPTAGATLNAVLGFYTAANDGIIHVVAPGDVTVNSVLAPRGGVYIQSTNGSIYAGSGIKPTSGITALNTLIGVPGMSTPVGGYWRTSLLLTKFAPVVYTFTNLSPTYNIISGSYSYLSSLYGTIGTGTAASKESWMSGSIYGTIKPGITSVTGYPSAYDLDPIYGYPSGYTTYYSYGTKQVYPETLYSGVTLNNPMRVRCDLVNTAEEYWAVRDGWTTTSALTLQFGGPNNYDSSTDNAATINQFIRAYYEIVAPHRIDGFEPATPVTFYAYHPLTPTDSTAFDGLTLDEGFYQFLDGNIQLNSPLNAYFGEEDSLKKK